MKFLVIILLGLSLYGNYYQTYSWDSTAAKYMPLQVGNVWVYSGYSATTPCHGTSWYDKYTLTGTIQINGKTYFQVSHSRIYLTGNCGWQIRLFDNNMPIRADSTSFNIYKSSACGPNSELLVDSLDSKLFDTAITCSIQVTCTDTSDYEIFGNMVQSKNFKVGNSWDNGTIQRYAKNLGLVSYFYYCGGSYTINLRGCVINGILYGDTTLLVGINQIGTEIPIEFELSQNYPNPFNPTTKIKFAVSGTSAARTFLSVYDLLGREVAVLVDEELQPGSYKADWNAADYPSGVYYYKLESGAFTETKKMVLIK